MESGLGSTVAVAGHIDDLRPSDRISLEMPHGALRYVVYAQRIVNDRDWSILRRRPFEKLVLSAPPLPVLRLPADRRFRAPALEAAVTP